MGAFVLQRACGRQAERPQHTRADYERAERQGDDQRDERGVCSGAVADGHVAFEKVWVLARRPAPDHRDDGERSSGPRHPTPLIVKRRC